MTRSVISPAVSRQPVHVVKVIITHDKRRDSSSTCYDETKRDETSRVGRPRHFSCCPKFVALKGTAFLRQGGIVLLKVCNKSQPEREKEEAGRDEARR